MAEIDDKRGAGGEDAAVEATVLRQLLLIHPAQVTVEELIVDVAADPDAFAERDAIERAVRELARLQLATLDPQGFKESNYDAMSDRRGGQIALWKIKWKQKMK